MKFLVLVLAVAMCGCATPKPSSSPAPSFSGVKQATSQASQNVSKADSAVLRAKTQENALAGLVGSLRAKQIEAEEFGNRATEVLRELRSDHDEALRELSGARANIDSLTTQLLDVESRTKILADERSKWEAYGNEMHEKWKNSQINEVKAKNSKLKWQMSFGVLSILVAGYFGLKFFTPLGRMIP